MERKCSLIVLSKSPGYQDRINGPRISVGEVTERNKEGTEKLGEASDCPASRSLSEEGGREGGGEECLGGVQSEEPEEGLARPRPCLSVPARELPQEGSTSPQHNHGDGR